MLLWRCNALQSYQSIILQYKAYTTWTHYQLPCSVTARCISTYVVCVGLRSLDQGICGQHGLHGSERVGSKVCHTCLQWLQFALSTTLVECGLPLHLVIEDRLRYRLKVAQVYAMIRLKLLCPPYDQFQYQPAIDLFDQGLDKNLLAQLNKEVSGVQAHFVTDNEEEDVQISSMLTGKLPYCVRLYC